jgi:hypothetical protein
MKILIEMVLVLSMLAFVSPLAAKGGQPVNLEYAGYGYDTSFEMEPDGFPANLTHARGKGTFGNSTVAITVEFYFDESQAVNCPDGYDLPFGVVPDNMWAFTVTAADHSQVYGLFNTGYLCMTADQLHWVGETQGIYVGGTGRYAGVSGEWVSTYEGMNLDAVTGFRSITGDVKGTLYRD